MKSSKSFSPLVKCPFCGTRVESIRLAEHAKQFHSPESNHNVNENDAVITPMDAIEIKNPDLFKGTKRYVVDESGVLVDLDLLQTEEAHKSREERWKHIIPNQISSKSEDYAPKSSFQSIAGKKERVVKHQPINTFQDTNSPVKDIYAAIDRALRSGQTTLIACPFCKAAIKPTKLIKHLVKAHPVKLGPALEVLEHAPSGLKNGNTSFISTVRKAPVLDRSKFDQTDIKVKKVFNAIEKENTSEQPGLTACPYCPAKVNPAKMKKHITKMHPSKLPLYNKAQKRQQQAQKGKSELRRDKPGLGWKEEQVDALEALRQSFDEKRDGSKGLGHMRREGDGKFGSFPLHDDYNDESDAESDNRSPLCNSKMPPMKF